jgi:hypothetical protein
MLRIGFVWLRTGHVSVYYEKDNKILGYVKRGAFRD